MLPGFPANYVIDGDGNAPPDFGGTEAVKYFTFTKTATTVQTAFTLPAGSTLVGLSVAINIAFDGGATLSVGTTGNATKYLSAGSVLGTLGPVYSTGWVVVNNWFTKLSSATPITVTVNGSPTVGSAVLTARYVMQ